MTPEGLDKALEFSQPGHRKLKDAIRSRLQMSESKMRTRYAQMTKNEERFQAYVPESENDAIRRRLRDDSGLPQYRTVEVPYSYAALMTAHTYYTSVFLARTPVLQVAGRHGEAEMNVQALEAILNYQMSVGEMMIPLFIWLLDPGKYGFGVIGHYWEEQNVTCHKVVEEPVTLFGIPIGDKMKKRDVVIDVPGYHGHKIYNVRPQDFYPDTRVPIRYFQRGEFCARYVEHSWFDIIQGERDGRYFNIKTLKKMRADKDAGNQSVGFASRDGGSEKTVSQLPEASDTLDFDVPPGFIKSYEMYIRLVPKDWGLGKGDKVEIWVVTASANGVIYGCEPLGEYHGQFPFDVIEHEPEGYALFSRSMLEISQPLADIVSWLFNTHFYNVRASLNNQWVADPSMVVMKDLEDPRPGKIIRLLPQAYGKDIRSLLAQMPVQDVTRGNLPDVQTVVEFIQRCLGVTDQSMGMLPTKSHTTATAVRTSSSFGVNRMKTNCEYYSAMGWSPFTQKLIQGTQQHLDIDRMYRVAGDSASFGKPFVQVNPEAIAGMYDYVPVDGTMPIDRFAQAQLWQMLIGQVAKMPQIAGQYDMGKIFGWVAGLAGIKNMAQFKLVPDEQLMQQAQRGNVVPISQAAQPKSQLPMVGPTQ